MTKNENLLDELYIIKTSFAKLHVQEFEMVYSKS